MLMTDWMRTPIVAFAMMSSEGMMACQHGGPIYTQESVLITSYTVLHRVDTV